MFSWFNTISDASRAGFAPMNWAESLYYGLNAAQLENAAGDFVAPTAASIDAAVSDATANPDGSLAFSYTKADAAAYPMPSVVYAAVPTTPMSATDVQPGQDPAQRDPRPDRRQGQLPAPRRLRPAHGRPVLAGPSRHHQGHHRHAPDVDPHDQATHSHQHHRSRSFRR